MIIQSYPLKAFGEAASIQHLSLPAGSKVLGVRAVSPDIWVDVEQYHDAHFEQVHFFTCQKGQEIDPRVTDYIGAVKVNGLVLHVYKMSMETFGDMLPKRYTVGVDPAEKSLP